GNSLLLERDRELQVVDGLVQDALDARPAVALVQGPAGIGKTRLLAEAREKAGAEGVRVLTARGGELERGLPFGVVGPALRAAVVRAGSGRSRRAGTLAHRLGERGGPRVRAPRGRAPSGRSLVRDPVRAVLADGEHRRGAAAAAGDRRPALVRSRIAAVPGL